MLRIKPSELKKFRTDQWERQNKICPLCSKEILPEESVMDHDHKNGNVRRVLHRSCNMVEGKILSYCKRSKSDDPVDFLQNLIRYWQTDFSSEPEHPGHQNEIIKRFKRQNRPEMIQQLTESGIEYDPNGTKAELIKIFSNSFKVKK